ncbi:MAG: alpha-glucan family phosphorylase [Phycisphaerales bacterium]|nr:alpha-glucan family phosphorylase [Phycisphaerales bacterium]
MPTVQGWTPPQLSPLPDPIARLLEVAYDLSWMYRPEAWAAFERLDRDLWNSTGHNPVRTIAALPAARLAMLSKDPAFVELVEAAVRVRASATAAARSGWFSRDGSKLPATLRPFQVAYFCAEFGLTECFQIYSGGLGLLAGDHLKSAADLGLPFIAVGLLYRNGYFHQALDEHGLQQEVYPPLDAPTQPVKRVLGGDGLHLKVYIDLPGRAVACAIWRAEVGGVRLYLLDTNIDENTPEDREITANLYLGDQRRRIEQEIVLGIGGVRALQAVGEAPTVFHMNEGHAAFMALERIRLIRSAHLNLSFDQAREAASPSHVFTTHTPVPAGIDHFNTALVKHYFGHYHDTLGLDLEGFMALGRENVADRNEPFSMAILAIRTSKWCNGVSRLHGRVSRTMWKNIWPGVPEGDIPIGHVTNGIHAAGWISPIMAALYDKHLGDAWRAAPDSADAWARIASIPDRDLWQARRDCRAAFVRYCAARAKSGHTGGCAAALDPELLTIGFARRFAGYKRATLMFRDPERLLKLLNGAPGGKGSRGFQLVIAGKSHPGDSWGKHLIREIVDFARDPRFKGRVLFLEDYGIDVAREMVRGCDIWLNTPIRGLEASGTSGMKAAMNGVLNASILDGWWDEGFEADLGFKIDDRGIFPNDAPDDDREDFESDALYRLIERTILPEFEDRGPDGVPARWVARLKRCIQRLTPVFNTHRMVKEYATKYYFPAHTLATRLAASEHGDMREARELADHIDRYRRAWSGVRIKSAHAAPDPHGDGVNIAAAVRLAGLRPDEVRVEAWHGAADEHGEIAEGVAVPLASPSALGDTTFHYTGAFDRPTHIERHAVCVRVLPGDARLASPHIPGLIASSPPTAIEPDHGLHV